MSAAPAVIDWPQMLRDLQYLLGDDLPGSVPERLPIGTRALAAHLGIKREKLRTMLDGSRMEHSDGELIIAHWMRLSGKQRAFVPMTRATLSAHKAERV